MARIRTIKPEFPQSESMGRVSRDSRLTFIQLWTLSDDAGRLRGNSRMLASLLFPYDDDAKDLIDGWLDELEREDCIQRYRVNGDSYVQIANWLIHQKIDKPSKSKIPGFDESSRELANPREDSSGDQGSRIKEGIKYLKETEAVASVVASASADDPRRAPQAEQQAAYERRVTTAACPVTEIVALYHELLPDLPRVRVMNPSREAQIRQRWREVMTQRKLGTRDAGLAWWRKLFGYVADSDFLMGRAQPRAGRRPFVADLEWLTAAKNFPRIVEGRYESAQEEVA